MQASICCPNCTSEESRNIMMDGWSANPVASDSCASFLANILYFKNSLKKLKPFFLGVTIQLKKLMEVII